ncbi:MAG: hypothetical protein M1816_006083 [Peltula sp. TS41687]|nr:MAG: hypothetical protein M1816_006083 [Peltula sp. TS41687]
MSKGQLPVFQELNAPRRTPADLLRFVLEEYGAEEDRGGVPRPSLNPYKTQVQYLLSLGDAQQHARLLEAIVEKDNKEEEQNPSDDAIETDVPSKDSGESLSILLKDPRLAWSFRVAGGPRELVRRVNHALSNEEGRTELKRHRFNLTSAFIRYRSDRDCLPSINLIACGFRRHSIPLGRDLCLLGISLSVEEQCATATRQYILECHTNQYDIFRGGWSRIIWSLQRGATLGRAPASNPLRFGAWRRHDALRLLTGCRTGGNHDLGEHREVGLIDCIRLDDEGSLKTYIRALGTLRASDCLWRLWLQLQAKRYHDRKPPESLSMEFIRAFIRARDPPRAVRIIIHSDISASTLGITLWHLICREEARRHLGCSTDPSVLRTLLSKGYEGSFMELFKIGYGKDPMDFLPLIEHALGVSWVPVRPLRSILPVGLRRGELPNQVSWAPQQDPAQGHQNWVHIRKGSQPVRYF